MCIRDSQKGDSIQFHFIDTSIFDDVKDRLHRFTVGTMFRLMLPEILPNLNKIIYLDADLLVNRDVKGLWDIDVSNYCVAGVRDYGTYRNTENPYPVVHGLVDRGKYINAGVVDVYKRQVCWVCESRSFRSGFNF